MVTEKEILTALSTVMEPELHKDLVTLNMVKDIRIDNGNVNLKIILTTPACPLMSGKFLGWVKNGAGRHLF